MLFTSFLVAHIAAGFSALIAGLLAAITKHGSTRHKRAGRIYYWAMLLVFISATVMSILHSNAFLFSIGIFSFYLTHSGVRLVQRKNQKASLSDKSTAAIMLATSIGMLVLGLTNLNMGFGVVVSVFGSIGGWFALVDLRRFFSKSTSEDPMAWFFAHGGRMGGAYISTVTAFVVTNFQFSYPLIGWLGPTLVGTLWIVLTLRKHRRRIKA